MKTNQIHFRITAEKHRLLKKHWSYGAIQKMGEIMIDDLLMGRPLSGLSDDARIEIEEIQLGIERARNRKLRFETCLREVGKGSMGVVAKFGLKRKILQMLTHEVRRWWYEHYGLVPGDAEIHEALKGYFADHAETLDELRSGTFQATLETEHANKTMARAITRTFHAMVEPSREADREASLAWIDGIVEGEV